MNIMKKQSGVGQRNFKMGKKIKNLFGSITVVEIVVALAILVVAVLLVVAVMGAVQNEMNRISSGIIVDKNYSPEKREYRQDKNGVISYTYSSEKYYLCIEGEKDGKTVQYWFSTSPVDYAKYNIGDNYP